MTQSSRIVRFGLFEADLETGELRNRGLRIRIPEQVFQVLAILLEQPGKLVSRTELRNRLWPHDTFVDFDHGLNKAVNRLREALNDSAVNSRFVETVARRGYRLIVPVTREASPEASRVIGRIRLVVLPFENLSAQADQEFFSDGLTEEMISELSRLNPNRLGVIARTSAMQYKRTTKRIDEIGRELAVDYVLEGSVRRAETMVRITAQLIQVRDQTHLWAESYSRELANVFEVQHEVAGKVANSLAFELLPEQGVREELVSPEAHEAYLRGRFFWNQGGDKSAWTAIEWFEKAIEREPAYALAYSAMADCYGRLGWFAALPPLAAGEKAERAAARALKLADRLGEPHCSMALVRFWCEWNWSEAEREFQRALDLKPNYAAAHNWYAAYLNVMCRFAEAGAEQKIAEEWDPLSLIIAMNGADPYYFSRQYTAAIEALQKVISREPNFYPAYYNLGRACALSGMHEEAIEAFATASRLSRVRAGDAALGYAYALAGNRQRAEMILEEIERIGAEHYVPAPQAALIHLGLGNHDNALKKLEQGFEEKSFWMIYLNADPVYDPIRSESRFVNLLKRMDFPR